MGRVCLIVGLLLGACAGAPYERQMASIHREVADDRPDRAAAELARQLRAERDPASAALLRLELGTLRIMAGEAATAAAALSQADGQLEVVDLRQDDAAELAAWLFSDAARPYRAPAYEKLMVNVLGMAARASAGDPRGAVVEARRFDVIRRYFAAREDDPGDLVALGSYLAGVVHTAAGRPRHARSYYERAATLRGDLYGVTPPLGPDEIPVTVVVLDGTAPRKTSREIPTSELDVAERGATASFGGDPIQRITLVELTPRGAERAWPALGVDGAGVAIRSAADIDRTARAAFERARPALIRGAIARAQTQRATRGAAGALDGVGGLLAGIAAHVATTDTPDTRGWTTLPARVGLARLALPRGRHVITMASGDGSTRSRELMIPRRAGAALYLLWSLGDRQDPLEVGAAHR